MPHVTAASNVRPQQQDGRVVSVSTIVWAISYRSDFSWIDLNVIDESGWPATQRGICEVTEGLYFVGMLFQFGLTSGLDGGVGRDAAFVAEHIHGTRQQSVPSQSDAYFGV